MSKPHSFKRTPSKATRFNRQRRSRATVLLEFAIVLPIFLFLMVMTMDLTHVILVRAAATNSTYDAARDIAAFGSVQTRNGNNAAFTQAQSKLPAFFRVDPNPTVNATVQQSQDSTQVGGQTYCDTTHTYVNVVADYQISYWFPGFSGVFSVVQGQGYGRPVHATSQSIARCDVVVGGTN